MPELSHIDPRSAALLVMDYQVDTLTKFMTAAQSADAIACVADLIAMARDAGMMVLHVVVAFRPGHPEVSPLGCAKTPPFNRACPAILRTLYGKLPLTGFDPTRT